ncbi:putative gnat family protein [Lasiodiplodia theobromae]|uniref:Gnat family acetyltransferase n=1 Tax=Lasiodiplodia theobromae TaxID=45133 RepID=UPI0015C30134|nr:Gnat family acetyltransferase [Lasiodiplodia theobromae]KAF4544268.1 Gnat family acetyltransferase [Lasiodiplodia theobromae]KAF9641246.1 putative gnat family protein [Lasiodiplodia theobromae]
MPLEIRRLEEADVPQFVDITTAALYSSGMGRALHDDPPHPVHLEQRKEKLRKALSKPNTHHLKVVDTDNNDEIIAGAIWSFFDNGRSDEELKELEQPFEPIEEERERFGAAQKAFFGGYLHRVRRQLGKTPHYFLNLLVTHPNHHRRGAGGMLVRWGTQQADKVGLICFLEASEAGRPLYKRHGFEDQETVVFDFSKYGLSGTDTNTTMIRQPVKN